MAEEMPNKILKQSNGFYARAKQTALLMVGVPDYQAYLEHMQRTHPELQPMSKNAFFKRAQEGRFAGRKLNKCPC